MRIQRIFQENYSEEVSKSVPLTLLLLCCVVLFFRGTVACAYHWGANRSRLGHPQKIQVYIPKADTAK